MIEVYRIEHKDTRIGPFRTPTSFCQELAKKASDRDYLKMPRDDGLILSQIPWAWVFGAPTLRALKRWIFIGESVEENEFNIRRLHEEGFVWIEALIEEGNYRMGKSSRQLIYDGDEVWDNRLVAVHSLLELLEEYPEDYLIVN